MSVECAEFDAELRALRECAVDFAAQEPDALLVIAQCIREYTHPTSTVHRTETGLKCQKTRHANSVSEEKTVIETLPLSLAQIP